MKEKVKYYVGWHQIEMSFRFLLAVLIIAGGVLGVKYTVQAYPDMFNVTVAMEKNENRNVSPGELLVINFSQSVLAAGYENGIEVTPKTSLKFYWSDNNRKLTIAPEKFWAPETDYQLVLPEGKSLMLTQIRKTIFNFSTIKYPTVVKLFPENGSQNVFLDIEDPIKVDLNQSAKEYFLKFTLNPEVELAFKNNPDKSQFELLPNASLKRGQKYEIKIYAKYLKDDSESNYKEIYASTFETLPLSASNGTKDFALILEQSKRTTAPKISSGKYVDINLSDQIMTLFENGKVLDAYLISSGKRGMETPKGQTKIYNKYPRAFSKSYGLYMPFWMAITADGSRGIHELPEWPGGYKEGANHLGIPVSHGCVRLGVGPAKFVYNWVEIGTPVVVY